MCQSSSANDEIMRVMVYKRVSGVSVRVSERVSGDSDKRGERR